MRAIYPQCHEGHSTCGFIISLQPFFSTILFHLEEVNNEVMDFKVDGIVVFFHKKLIKMEMIMLHHST